MSTLDNFTTATIIAPDGTPIGYRITGSGPGLILLHGALQSSLNFTRLAAALADDFTVYVPDRRGRGLSGAYKPTDNLLTEANDIVALVRHTGTQNIFGLSSGAILTLKAALLESSLQKVALFEPPIPVRGTSFAKLDSRYTKAMQNGRHGKAFIAILKGIGSTSLMAKLPAFITVPFMNRAIKRQKKNLSPGRTSLVQLIGTFSHDQLVAGQSLPLVEEAAKLHADVLLMGGSKSNRFLKNVLEDLQTAMPGARRVVLENEGHLAADNSGSPEKVAGELVRFYLKPSALNTH